MSPTNKPLAKSIAAFLATSRIHLDLPCRRKSQRPLRTTWPRELRRQALNGSSIGSGCSNAAYAGGQHEMDARAQQRGEVSKVSNAPAARSDLAAKSSIERMP